MDKLRDLTNAAYMDPSEDTVMPAVAQVQKAWKALPRSEFASLSELILTIDDAASRAGNLGSMIAAMSVRSLVKLYAAAPTDLHYLRAMRAWARECSRQNDEWAGSYHGMLTELITARQEMEMIADAPLTGLQEVEGFPPDEDGDELDAAIEEARKDPRWPDVAAVIAVLSRKIKF